MTTLARTFPGHVDQIAEARHWLEAALRAVRPRIPEATKAAASLLLSEVGTNAVLHTASGQGGKFTVTARVDAGHLHVQVADDGGAATRPHITRPRPDTERGRGLALVDAFADHWGPLTPGPGVYFQLIWPTPHPSPPVGHPPALTGKRTGPGRRIG
ncbi:ATP-binding protein, partial [Nocardiopsis trehalosi]|uniref:ATP-binding protein n=1 Tax=Nocardiopsis trehalosi TaxID=109329 RepID=UPI000A00E4E7